MSPQLEARRRRVASIRRWVATLAVSVFLALFGTIYAEQSASTTTTAAVTTVDSPSTSTGLAPLTTSQS